MVIVRESWRERFKTPLAVVCFVVLGGAFVALWAARTRHPGFLSQAAAECRRAYQRAQSPADSTLVDARQLGVGVKGDPTPLTCGSLRSNGEL